MALVYFDTSALVKLFIDEIGSGEVLALTRIELGHVPAFLEFTPVEFYSAVRRREEKGHVPAGFARTALTSLNRYLVSQVVTQPVTRSVLDRACDLIDRHLLSGYDAMQLAGGSLLANSRPGGDLLFVCADRKLVDAARAEGLRTFDPLRPGLN